MCVQKGAELTTPRPFLASTPKSGNSLFLLWREGVGMMEKKKWNECVTLDIQEKKKKKACPGKIIKQTLCGGTSIPFKYVTLIALKSLMLKATS